MSDTTISLEFIGRRLDVVQNDVADVRRRMVTLSERFGGIEDRISGLENRMSTIEKRQGTPEIRIDTLLERISGLETITHQGNARLQRIAAKVGVDDE